MADAHLLRDLLRRLAPHARASIREQIALSGRRIQTAEKARQRVVSQTDRQGTVCGAAPGSCSTRESKCAYQLRGERQWIRELRDLLDELDEVLRAG